MAEQKAVSKKTATGKVATGKAAAVKTARAVVDAVKKVALKKTDTAEAKKTKPANKPVAGAVAESKPAAARTAKKAAGVGRNTAPASADRTPEHRYRMVETAAYFIAERNGFQGDAAEHWRAAELEIERLLG